MTGKINKDILVLKGVFFAEYPDRLRLELKNTFGNIDKIIIITPQNIIYKDLSNQENTTYPYTQKSFFELTGIDYDYKKLMQYLGGFIDLDLSKQKNISSDENNIIFNFEYENLYWDEEIKAISKIITIKGTEKISEVKFSSFEDCSGIGQMPLKISINQQSNNKLNLKITLSDVVCNRVLNSEIFNK